MRPSRGPTKERMLTLDLLQAAADVLERERHETDWWCRARLLTRTRATLDRWRAGRLTAEQATSELRELQWQRREAAPA